MLMNKNPLETIASWLQAQSLKPHEKQALRQTLISYATKHPVKSGLLSPYAFRYAMVALASLVIVLGGSIGVTAAAAKALPNQPLYGVKIWIEDFKANAQKTPQARIAFETGRIETRFNEATTLAVNHQLDDSASQIIQSGLQHSREAIQASTTQIQNVDPEYALATTTNLETTFSSNGQILATIEKNTNENIGTFVLAAEASTKSLSLERMKYEAIVLNKPNADTTAATEQKLADITAKLDTTPTTATTTLPVTVTDASDATVPPAGPVSATGTTTAPDTSATTAATVATPAPIINPTAAALVQDAKLKIDQGSYSAALVTLQNAEQAIDETKLTQSLETTYHISVDPNASATVPPVSATADASSTTTSSSSDASTAGTTK